MDDLDLLDRVNWLEKKVEELAKELITLRELKTSSVTSNQDFIAKYIDAWRARYGSKTRPNLGGKTQGLIKRFLQDVSHERAVALIQVYFQMDDPWFVTKCHDFVTFIENLDKIGLALDTGKTSKEQQRKGIASLLQGDQKLIESHGV